MKIEELKRSDGVRAMMFDCTKRQPHMQRSRQLPSSLSPDPTHLI